MNLDLAQGYIHPANVTLLEKGKQIGLTSHTVACLDCVMATAANVLRWVDLRRERGAGVGEGAQTARSAQLELH